MMVDNEKSTISDGDILEAAKCREVVQEILDFGVNQRQLLIIIKLLALELEDNGLMKNIAASIDDKLTTAMITNSTAIIT